MEGLHTSRARPSPANFTESGTVMQRLLDNYEEDNTGWRAAKPLAEAFSEAFLGHQQRGSPEQLRSAPPPALDGRHVLCGQMTGIEQKAPGFFHVACGTGQRPRALCAVHAFSEGASGREVRGISERALSPIPRALVKHMSNASLCKILYNYSSSICPRFYKIFVSFTSPPPHLQFPCSYPPGNIQSSPVHPVS